LKAHQILAQPPSRSDYVLDENDGFREGLNPSYDLLPDGLFGYPVGQRIVCAGGVPAHRLPRSQASTMIRIAKIKYLGAHRLRATFSDGAAGDYDFSAIVAKNGPMVEPLRDPIFFARVFLENGALTWPNGFDVCPDWFRREMEISGAILI
jgi:hypothetical protein